MRIDQNELAAETKQSILRFLEHIELSTGQIQLPDKRRSAWRYEWHGSAVVRCLDTGVPSEPMYVLASHISPVGLEFRCSCKLDPGQEVMITLDSPEGDLEVPATVVHATASIGRNIIGVKFGLE